MAEVISQVMQSDNTGRPVTIMEWTNRLVHVTVKGVLRN